jgi:hypothetical protein
MKDWLRERREVPAEILAEAAANPGGSVAQIDGDLVADPNGYIPGEAVMGVFVVGPDGVPTGEFLHNPNYGTVLDDFTRLSSPDHWLGWLPGEPAMAVRQAIADALTGQVPGSVVPWVKVIDEPVFLTGGTRAPDDPEKIVVTRAALAVPFALSVVPPNGEREVLTGVFSWAAAGLDTADGRHDRVWLDLGMDRPQAEALLQERVYGTG